jgi:Ca2+-binding RTX toxin-like protein
MGAQQEDDMAIRSKTSVDLDATGFDTMAFGPGLGDPVPTTGFLLQGTAGNDMITGTSLDDMILGLAGNDRLYGEGGNDTLDGGLGDDYLLGGRGADTLIGGAGIDTASYANSGAAVRVDLRFSLGYGADAERDTFNGIENLTGSNFDDDLNGDAGDNTLNGGLGNDFLVGGRGQDILIGGAGKDRLFGDSDGGYARDIFMITREGAGVFDVIQDFQSRTDLISLSGFTPSAFGSDHHLGSGNLLQDGASHHTEYLDAGDKLYFDTFTQTLYAVDVRIEDGHARLVSVEALVEVHQVLPYDPHVRVLPPIDTHDIIFV